MRNQKGFTLIEFLIVAAIISIVAAIAIPSILQVRAAAQIGPFNDMFGIDLYSYMQDGVPTQDWLDKEQKSIIRPLVMHRIEKLCADKNYPSVLDEKPVFDPYIVQLRLRRLQAEREEISPETCEKAREVAAKFGLLPAEAQQSP